MKHIAKSVKTTWAKTLPLASLVFILSFSDVLAQDHRTDLFVGVWELVGTANVNTNGNVMKAPPGNYKVFGADGSYRFMRFHPQGSCFAQEGSFRVLSDSTYVEQINRALVKQLEGNQYEIDYQVNEEGLLVIEGNVDDFRYREVWRRVSNCGEASASGNPTSGE